jgi:hypothetical protein
MAASKPVGMRRETIVSSVFPKANRIQNSIPANLVPNRLRTCNDDLKAGCDHLDCGNGAEGLSLSALADVLGAAGELTSTIEEQEDERASQQEERAESSCALLAK